MDKNIKRMEEVNSIYEEFIEMQETNFGFLGRKNLKFDEALKKSGYEDLSKFNNYVKESIMQYLLFKNPENLKSEAVDIYDLSEKMSIENWEEGIRNNIIEKNNLNKSFKVGNIEFYLNEEKGLQMFRKNFEGIYNKYQVNGVIKDNIILAAKVKGIKAGSELPELFNKFGKSDAQYIDCEVNPNFKIAKVQALGNTAYLYDKNLYNDYGVILKRVTRDLNFKINPEKMLDVENKGNNHRKEMEKLYESEVEFLKEIHKLNPLLLYNEDLLRAVNKFYSCNESDIIAVSDEVIKIKDGEGDLEYTVLPNYVKIISNKFDKMSEDQSTREVEYQLEGKLLKETVKNRSYVEGVKFHSEKVKKYDPKGKLIEKDDRTIDGFDM